MSARIGFVVAASIGVLFLLTVACFVWMHTTVHGMLQAQSPHLKNSFETSPH